LGNVALISLNMEDKIKHIMKSAELYLIAGMFDKSDEAIRKAVGGVDLRQKQEIQNSILKSYKKIAEEYENSGKKHSAVELYERILKLNLNSPERDFAMGKLKSLYMQLGRAKDWEKVSIPKHL